MASAFSLASCIGRHSQEFKMKVTNVVKEALETKKAAATRDTSSPKFNYRPEGEVDSVLLKLAIAPLAVGLISALSE
jgi:hypothetical protein